MVLNSLFVEALTSFFDQKNKTSYADTNPTLLS